MSKSSNSYLISRILEVLIQKVARRTSKQFAIETIQKVVQNCQKSCDVIKYISLNKDPYLELSEIVQVDKLINSVDPQEVFVAVEEILKFTVKDLKKSADYFFIREFQEAVDDIDHLRINTEDMNLGVMQLEYIIDRKQSQLMKKNELIFNVLKALIFSLNRYYNDEKVIEIIKESIEYLKDVYVFLDYVRISKKTDGEGFYLIDVGGEINDTLSYILTEGMQKFLEYTINKTDLENKNSIIDDLKKDLGEKNLNEIENFGVKLDRIRIEKSRYEEKDIIKKSLESLIKVIGMRTSDKFAVTVISHILENLKKSNENSPLRMISIDITANSSNLPDFSIDISPNIKYAGTREIAKGLQEIVKMAGTHLGNKTISFVNDFKNQLGNNYVTAMQDLGVNFQLLEFKFGS
ncbi:MAG: hypothetical protein JXA91_00070 [Candidatus Thermoplasmatota archaeon]|nr:hypothetical protein [Candidatus Thermoplasmatota archaeon]